jgi:hypothetical protein
MLTEIDDMSIELYQNIKYISEGEVFEYNTNVKKSFRNMDTHINYIRGNMQHFGTQFN